MFGYHATTTCQVVEELNSLRRAAVIDTATGKAWIPPDSGWLRVKFKASRELPNMKVSEVTGSLKCIAVLRCYGAVGVLGALFICLAKTNKIVNISTYICSSCETKKIVTMNS